MTTMSVHSPSLFGFATSELSQDAFICWLLAWADPRCVQDMKMHAAAYFFIGKLFEKTGRTFTENIESIEIKKQYGKIDVFVLVNKRWALIIEDKTDTSNHTGQLRRYYDYVLNKGFSEENILPFYFKTGDQSCYKSVEKAGYSPFLREDFLEVLRYGHSIGVNNDIYLDFHSHLESIERKVSSYQTLPLDGWHWSSWVGFAKEIKTNLQQGNWGYVANPNGGFLGYWWNGVYFEGEELYLQLEEETLCIKVKIDQKELRSKRRNEWSKKVLSYSADYGLNFVRPKRFGKGHYMTIAVFDGEYRKMDGQGALDVDETVALLKKCELLVNSFSEGYRNI